MLLSTWMLYVDVNVIVVVMEQKKKYSMWLSSMYITFWRSVTKVNKVIGIVQLQEAQP